MMGVLACVQCAVLSHDWVCLTPDGEYVVGHLPANGRPQEQDFDSWGHIETHGPHLAMARRYPWSALQQGAEDYLRWLAHRPTASRVIAQASKDLQDTLYRWDRRDPRDDVPDGSARTDGAAARAEVDAAPRVSRLGRDGPDSPPS
jgi:hypothetical protein